MLEKTCSFCCLFSLGFEAVLLEAVAKGDDLDLLDAVAYGEPPAKVESKSSKGTSDVVTSLCREARGGLRGRARFRWKETLIAVNSFTAVFSNELGSKLVILP